MYELMCDQITLLTESLIAYTTAVWLHPTMYALMSDQTAFLTECLTTNFTVKTTLSTVYPKLFVRSSLEKKIVIGRRMYLKVRHTLGK